jgi:2'-5' RNA ligase
VTQEEADAEARWQEFEQLDRMRGHWWWRPGWRVGCRYYTWHLTFEHAVGLHALVRRYHAALADISSLDSAPPAGLHLTMQGVGFDDEVSPADIRAISDRARIRCRQLSAFAIHIGPGIGFPEGIPMQVRPWAPIGQLRLALRRAIADVWGSDNVPEPADGFRPHVTLAYCNTDTEAAPVRGRLARLRSLPPATVDVRAAQLILLDRDNNVYHWSVAETVGLSPADGT